MDKRQIQQIQQMQQKLLQAQEDIEKTQFNGTAGGGAVAVTINGKFEMTAIKIDPEAINAEDITELEVMVLAAAKDAYSKASEAQQKMLGGLTGGLNIPGLF